VLILTRKLGESINIGDEIKVTVMGFMGRSVRIGVDAPPQIIVHREEVTQKIREGAQTPKKSKRFPFFSRK
jgi:carbon storage regulator